MKTSAFFKAEVNMLSNDTAYAVSEVTLNAEINRIRGRLAS